MKVQNTPLSQCPDFPMQSSRKIRLPARPAGTANGETRSHTNISPCVGLGDRGVKMVGYQLFYGNANLAESLK